MVAQPRSHRPDWVDEVRRLDAKIDAVARKTLYSASIGAGGLKISNSGSMSVEDAAGVTEFYIGGGLGSAHADGTPQQVTVVADENNHWRLALWDPSNPASKTNQQLYMWDAEGNQVFTTDNNGGWATPWLNVPMYPRFTPPQNSTDTNGTVYDYATISTSAPNIAQGQMLWEGRIPYVTHPRITVDGTWGQAGGSVVPTYTLSVGGSTVGSWSPSGLVTSQVGPWDISSLLNKTAVQVAVTVSWSSSGVIAADLLSVYLRQT